jgi:DNA recombination protein RmuC
MVPWILATSAFLAGLLLGWWLSSWRRQAQESGANLVEQERWSTAREEKGRIEAERDAARSEVASLRIERSQALEESVRLREQLAQAQARREAAEIAAQERQQVHARELSSLRELQASLVEEQRNAFRVLGTQALQETQPVILERVKELFATLSEGNRGDLDRRHESIATLLKPLEEQLRTHQERLAQAEQSQSRALSEVRLQLEQMTRTGDQLARETEQFRGVLRSGTSRGRWGEETLRRVVEAAGLSPHCDFQEQFVAGESRPDLVVHLPGDRHIVVDAKVPELDNLEDGQDPSQRSARSQAHARALRETVKALSDRRYPENIPGSLDHVVLFLPAESLFSAALEGDPDLLVWASQRRILLATPTSLIALLRSVALGWQYWSQSENTRQIAQSTRELMDRLQVFAGHLERIHKGLESAGTAWNQASASWRSRVLPAGKRVLELGGGLAESTLPVLASSTLASEGSRDDDPFAGLAPSSPTPNPE